MQHKTATLNGKRIAYHSETVFVIQTGKGYKGSYKTSHKVKGDLAKAAHLYESINIGPGFKKRLLMTGTSKPVLARYVSTSIHDPRKSGYNL